MQIMGYGFNERTTFYKFQCLCWALTFNFNHFVCGGFSMSRKWIVCAMFALAAISSQAAMDRAWTGLATTDPRIGPGDWFNAGNWNTALGLDPNVPPTASQEALIAVPGANVNVYFRAADPNGDPNIACLTAYCRGLRPGAITSPVKLTIWPKATLITAGGGENFETSFNATESSIFDVYGTLVAGNGIYFARRGPSTITIYDGGYFSIPVNTLEFQGGDGTINVQAGGALRCIPAVTMARYRQAGTNTWSILNVNGGQAEFGGNIQMGRITVTAAPGQAEVHITDGEMIVGYMRAVDGLGVITGAANLIVGQDAGTLPNPSSTAIVNVAGGRLIVTGTISSNVTDPAAVKQVNLTGGQLSVRSWTTANMGDIVNAGGVFSPATVNYNSGTGVYTIDETHRAEMTFVTGKGYKETSTAAVVQIDIEGTTQWSGNQAQYDHIALNGGNVTLMGDLKVIMRGSYVNTASPSDVLNIFTGVGAGSTGTFKNLVSGRVNAYNESGGLEGTFLVTYPATFPGNITLSNLIMSNVPPTITASNVYTYDAVKSSILIDTTVTHPLGLADITYAWAVVSQPAGSTITPDPTTLTTNDISIGVDMMGDYTLRLTATHIPTGKLATKDVMVAVEADACAAALRSGAVLSPGDINSDCKVNLDDFVLMAANWLDCVSQVCP
jgi:hypothetical protein